MSNAAHTTHRKKNEIANTPTNLGFLSTQKIYPLWNHFELLWVMCCYNTSIISYYIILYEHIYTRQQVDFKRLEIVDGKVDENYENIYKIYRYMFSFLITNMNLWFRLGQHFFFWSLDLNPLFSIQFELELSLL